MARDETKLKENYLTSHHERQMLEQLSTLNQLSSSVTQCMDNFDNLILRCDLHEGLLTIVSRFINGLRQNVKGSQNVSSR